MEEKKKALIIVDVQKAFDDKNGERNNVKAEENISKILKLWREKRMDSHIHTTHF